MVSCYSAFQSLLKSLCLKEFPCGSGSWRPSDSKFVDSHFSVSLKDYGAQYEKIEYLQEYLDSGTWDCDCEWSTEAAALRKLAVNEPWLFSEKIAGDKFLHEFFRTLRIIDKEITEVGPSMLKFKNLRDLTLSVNLLTEIKSEHLPPTLQVLELCTNHFTSVVSLCSSTPPPLLHLGLSHNKLASPDEYKYFSSEYWPSLMSLDLSYNSLTYLVELVDRLSSLGNLRNLVLQGNPVTLIPGYRGHTIDALKTLTSLDDVSVSADERHHFKGLGKKKSLILDEALLGVSIGAVHGLPRPEELVENDERPEFPIIKTEYVIRYSMLNDLYSESARVPSQLSNQEESPELETPVKEHRVTEVAHFNVDVPLPAEWKDGTFNVDYKKQHFVDDLVFLRDFLLEDFKISVVERKTLSWPVEEEPEPEVVTKPKSASKKGKPKSATKRGKSAGKTKTPATTDKGDSKGGKKGGKTPAAAVQPTSEELRTDPPVERELGSAVVQLKQFLEGSSEFVSRTLYCGGGPEPDQTTKEQLINHIEEEVPEPKSSKGKGKAAKTPKPAEPAAAEDENAAPPPPPPLLVKLDVRLRKWKTAADSKNPPV